MTTPVSAEAQVIANFKAQLKALIDGEYEALGELMSEGYTRTHLDGKTITKSQWLERLRGGENKYHSFEEVSIKADVDGSRATLDCRTISDATLYGERKKWRLHLRQHLIKSNGKWLVTRSVATLW